MQEIEKLAELQEELNRRREEHRALLEAVGPFPPLSRAQRIRRRVRSGQMGLRTRLGRWIAPWLEDE